MDEFQALHQFWSSFDLPAYDENTVPDNAALPRLTYSVSKASLDEIVLMSASIWYRSTSWTQITKKAMEIGRRIGRSGVLLRYDGGVLWITRGVPFSQRMSDEDSSIRRIYFNISAEYISGD